MHDSERGMALIFVTILLVVVLVGGMALVATTSGELSSSRGYRARAVTDACAEAALQKVRALMPDVTFSQFDGTGGQLPVGSTTLTYRPSHYTGDGDAPVVILDAAQFDVSALFAGENITNVMGTVAGGNLQEGINVVSTTVVCGGGGYGTREMQVVFRYGTAMGAR